MKLCRAVFVCLLLLFALDELARGQQAADGQQVEMKRSTSDGGEMSYLLYLPQGYQTDTQKSFPMIFFLHGRGESYGPLSLVAKWGPPRMAARGDQLPYIIVSPQCPEKDNWSSETQQKRLMDLLDDIETNYRVDKHRVYLTGLSMGGYGTWTLAADHPDRFAAAVPICGGGDTEDAAKLKDLPIWVFHGDQDRAVPFQKSVEMVDAIKEAGGTKIRFTSLENFGHNSWTSAYAHPGLYEWMDRQSKR